jgi:hypothetical protein
MLCALANADAQKLPLLSESFELHADGCYLFIQFSSSLQCVLLSNAANCCNYVALLIDEWMSVECWCNDTGRGK